MSSTKDLPSNSTTNFDLPSCIVPSNLIHSSENLTKGICKDPSHAGDDHDTNSIREGERVYAMIADNNFGTDSDPDFEVRSIACRECSAQSIYEHVQKDTKVYVVTGVLLPEIPEPTENPDEKSFDLHIDQIQILDEYEPM